MNCPLVSIVVAAYNVEAYISECLESILAQDYKSYELIVINDASTDDTSLIIDFFQKKINVYRLYIILRILAYQL